MTEIEENEGKIIDPNELVYETRTIRGKTYKILVKPLPYRIAKMIREYIQDMIDPVTKEYNFGGKEVSELSELILCNLVTEPKIDAKFLESDECPIGLMGYSSYLFKKVMGSEDIKKLTGLEFEDEDIENLEFEE